MESREMKDDFSEKLFDELIEFQQKLLLKSGRAVISTLTSDDILQPNDFPSLENNPSFRYEEGVLAGILTAQAAFRARQFEVSQQNRIQDN